MPSFQKRPSRTIQTILRTRARQMRGEMPLAERMLWSRLKADQLNGHRFRRQHRVGVYIVDFHCAKLKLIVECNGESHDDREKYDEDRDAYLRGRGLRVIRFSNQDVISNLDGVLLAVLKAVEAPAKNPSPQPSP